MQEKNIILLILNIFFYKKLVPIMPTENYIQATYITITYISNHKISPIS